MGIIRRITDKVTDLVAEDIHDTIVHTAATAVSAVSNKIEAHKIKKNNKYTKTAKEQRNQSSYDTGNHTEVMHLPDYQGKE